MTNPVIPLEAVEAAIRRVIAAMCEHLERHGPLPELTYKKRSLIHNGRKSK